jgi:hypothetical protein
MRTARALRLAAEVARRMLPGGAHQRFTSPIHHVAIEQLQVHIQSAGVAHGSAG